MVWVLDTDYLPALPLLAGFLLLFSYLSLVQHSAIAASLSTRAGRRSRWLVAVFGSLRHACIIALVISGLAFVYPVSSGGWWTVSFLGLGLLALLVSIDRISSAMSPNRIAWTTGWLRFASGARNLVLEGRDEFPENGRNGNNGDHGPHGDENSGQDEPDITDEELTNLDQRDREMFRSILRLDITTAREIMVPRLDMIAVEINGTLKQVADSMVQGGHSRLPVFEETSDKIVGIVHSREVLEALAGSKEIDGLGELLHPAFFIPETKRLDELLQELQDKGEQMAIVVDEYGGMEGLVTMEDLLEEIVGEIEDEFSRTRESEVLHLPEGGVLVDAGIPTNEVEELFDISMESEDVDTVGGYVYQALGRIPQIGDFVTAGPLRIEVVSVLGRRLRKLRIDRMEGETSSQSH